MTYTPRAFLPQTTTLVCDECSALVVDSEQHDRWHDDMAEARWQGMAAYECTGGLT